MTTYNTGNPVPSTAVRDLFDNAENFDTAMNDLVSATWVDRLGRVRKTYFEIERLADPGTALAAAVRAEEARDRAEDAADLVQASSNTLWLKLYSELIAFPPADHTGVPAVVTNDSDPARNGYYVSDGITWVYMDLQPLQRSDLDAFKAEITGRVDELEEDVQAGLVSTGTPGIIGFEFHNTYPEDSFFLDKHDVHIDSNNKVIGHVTDDGVWDLRGINSGSAPEAAAAWYEFHNTLDVAGIRTANIDSGNKIFSSYDREGGFSYIGSGGSSPGGTGRFDFNPLTQMLGYIWYGQSLSNGSTSLPPISLTQPFANLTFGAGPKATKAGSLGVNPGTDTVKPLVEDDLAGDGAGAHGETSCSGFANYLSVLLAQEGFSPAETPIFSSTAGHGGYSITQLNETSAWYQVWKDHVDEATARAAELGKQLIIPALNWIQGESNRSTDLMTYVNLMISLREAQAAYVKERTGQTWDPPMLMYQTNSFNPEDSGSSSAQLWLANNFPDKFKIVVPCFVFPNSEDGLHLTNVGSKWMGAYFSRPVFDIVLNRTTANYIVPGIPVKQGLVSIRVPNASSKPLQLLARDITQNGYRVRVNGTTRAASIALEGSDVIITPNTPLDSITDVVQVTYAREFKTAAAYVNIREGDLCDTSDEVVVIEGNSLSLKAWCPSFSEIAITADI